MTIKLADGEILCKKKKLVSIKDEKGGAESQGQGAEKCVASSSSTRIFALNTDCIDQIFEYLSLKDIHSVGQTCRALQRAAGEYFKLNFSAAEKCIGNDGIYTIYPDNNGATNQRIQTSCFNRFTEFISHHYEEFEPFRYIETHSDEFPAVKHLYFVCVGLNAAKMKYFQAILPKIEIVQCRQCTIWDGEFHEFLLRSCDKMKRLYVQDDLGDIVNRVDNTWMLQKYPNLKHLELTPRYSFIINELGKLFELNPQLSSFSTSSHCMWINRQTFLESNIKLDSLEIKHFDSGFYFYHVERLSVPSICNLLNELFAKGVYKKVHLYIHDIDEPSSQFMVGLQGFDKLSIRNVDGSGCHLARLVNIRELSIFDCARATDLEKVATQLQRLERIMLQNVSYDNILPFVRFSSRLKRMKIFPKDAVSFKALDLQQLNAERAKLPRPQKLIIYMEDNVFLATKWAAKNGDTDLKFVEMKRSNSLCWDDDHSAVRTLH